jgi:hypothetical protein
MKEMKRVGVIGPTNPSLIESKLGLPEGTFEAAAKRMGAFLASNSFALLSIPARSVNLWVLETYHRERGPDALAFVPSAPEQSQDSIDEMRRNASMAHRIRDNLTWGDSPFELAKACDYLVALGLSCGTLMEMACTKWFDGPPIYVVSPYISQIPVEMLAEIDVRFCESIEALQQALIRDSRGD